MRHLLFIVAFLGILSVNAQTASKVGCVDTKYIFSKIPEYLSAETKLKELSSTWEKEIAIKKSSIDQLHRNFEADKILLSSEMKIKKEQEITSAEKELIELQNKYFGENGELFKEREKLIKPIQDKVFKAIKDYAESKSYSVILDRSSDLSVLYVNSKNEISNDILKQLGYSN